MKRLCSVNIRLALFMCFVWSLACSVLCVWLYMIEILAHKLGVLNIFSKAANIFYSSLSWSLFLLCIGKYHGMKVKMERLQYFSQFAKSGPQSQD